jgi:hypothetical protein
VRIPLVMRTHRNVTAYVHCLRGLNATTEVLNFKFQKKKKTEMHVFNAAAVSLLQTGTTQHLLKMHFVSVEL